MSYNNRWLSDMSIADSNSKSAKSNSLMSLINKKDCLIMYHLSCFDSCSNTKDNFKINSSCMKNCLDKAAVVNNNIQLSNPGGILFEDREIPLTSSKKNRSNFA